MPAKKKVTLEQIYAKLESHDRHFEKYDSHFEKHDRHFEKHDRQLEGLTQLFFKLEDSVKAEVAKVLDRVRNLEANVEKQTGDLEKLQQEYFALTQSVKRIEKTLEAQSTREKSDKDEFAKVLLRLDRIERHLGFIEEATPLPGS